MRFKKTYKKLLFPPISVALFLTVISAVFLTYSLINMPSASPCSILSYVISFYTLLVWCLKINYLISFFKKVKSENKYIKHWRNDVRFRINLSLFASLIFNVLYTVFQLCLGVYHKSVWYFSMAAYYFLLTVMRLLLLLYTSRYKTGENMKKEIAAYRFCGIVFLIINLALAVMIMFMVYLNRTFHHSEITVIAMATYTFATMTAAIIGVFKYKKFGSPVYSAAKAISLASACVSMLTLTSTMLNVFDNGTVTYTQRQIMLAATGFCVSAFIITMAIYMIVKSVKLKNSLIIKE